MARKKNRFVRKIYPKYSVIVDGKTEIWYFQAMKEFFGKDAAFNIKPELPKRKSLIDMFSLAYEMSQEGYDKVFLLLDLDKILQDNKINVLKNQLNNIKTDNIFVLINNPCLEFWFLLHYVNKNKVFVNCKQAEKELKRYLRDYEKSKRFFLYGKRNIYELLFNLQNNAINRASKLGEFDVTNPAKSLAEIYKFIIEIKKLSAG